MTDGQIKMYMLALPALVDMRQKESKGQIDTKYFISGLIADAIHFYRREIINEGFDDFEYFKKQLTITPKGTCSKEVEKYIRITDQIGQRSKLLRLFLAELVKACEAESGLSAGLLTTVKPATFLETIEFA